MKQLIILINIALLLTACGGKKAAEEKSETQTNETIVTLTDAQLKNAGIQTGKLEQKTISTVLSKW